VAIKKKHGFTLIELIICIALGMALAIAAYLKFFNLTSDAQTKVTANLASQLNSAARMNYYARTVNPAAGLRITNCRNVANTLQAPLPPGYSITSLRIPTDAIVNCTLKGPSNSSANFYARGVR
jgi:prepilin-type N-terminal cleavage/methylation domain-containing protein